MALGSWESIGLSQSTKVTMRSMIRNTAKNIQKAMPAPYQKLAVDMMYSVLNMTVVSELSAM